MAAHSCAMEALDSDSEDEIFFGPVSAKERIIATPLQNRRTEIFLPQKHLFCLDSSPPSSKDDVYLISDSDKELSQALSTEVAIDSADINENGTAYLEGPSIKEFEIDSPDVSSSPGSIQKGIVTTDDDLRCEFDEVIGTADASIQNNLILESGNDSVEPSSLISEMHIGDTGIVVSWPVYPETCEGAAEFQGLSMEKTPENNAGEVFVTEIPEQQPDSCGFVTLQPLSVEECKDIQGISEVRSDVSYNESIKEQQTTFDATQEINMIANSMKKDSVIFMSEQNTEGTVMITDNEGNLLTCVSPHQITPGATEESDMNVDLERFSPICMSEPKITACVNERTNIERDLFSCMSECRITTDVEYPVEGDSLIEHQINEGTDILADSICKLERITLDCVSESDEGPKLLCTENDEEQTEERTSSEISCYNEASLTSGNELENNDVESIIKKGDEANLLSFVGVNSSSLSCGPSEEINMDISASYSGNEIGNIATEILEETKHQTNDSELSGAHTVSTNDVSDVEKKETSLVSEKSSECVNISEQRIICKEVDQSQNQSSKDMSSVNNNCENIDVSSEHFCSSERQNQFSCSGEVDSSAESCGVANEGLIFSQTPDLDSCSSSSIARELSDSAKVQILGNNERISTSMVSSDCSQYAEKSPAELDAQNLNSLKECYLANDVEITASPISKDSSTKSDSDEDGDEIGNESCSSGSSFNDTIEEMEMFLKYGPNYGEVKRNKKNAGAESTSPLISKDFYDGMAGQQDESVIGPRKSSISSIVSNFNPEINSTQDPCLKSQKSNNSSKISVMTQNVKQDNELVMRSPSKSVPPPKPPRNINLLCESPRSPSMKSTPKDHHQFSPKVSAQKPTKREVCLTSKQLTNKSSPVTPRIASDARMPSSNPTKIPKTNYSSPMHNPRMIKTPGVTPKGNVKRLAKTPNTVTGVTRSVSLINSKEKQLQVKTPGTFHKAMGLRFENRATPKQITHSAQQKTTPVLPERLLARPGLPPCPASSRTPRPFKSERGPLIKRHLRPGGLDIVSPVAQYLRENPPPSLVVNVKPRHKLQGEVEKASINTDVQVSKEAKEDKDIRKHKKRITPVLPTAVYSSAVPVVLDDAENKENERLRRCQEVAPGSQPVYVIKHKGRVRLPKEAFETVTKDSSPKRSDKSQRDLKAAASSPRQVTSLRGSLMEVSLYESHKTQYSNTLK
ncbi:uncharacterized protein [Palaemon carinicauda]|uniref:uncharacterized protein n=1 Tax=Palaemon carinicauda TaxID=392227 RepID=UPI0035B64036